MWCSCKVSVFNALFLVLAFPLGVLLYSLKQVIEVASGVLVELWIQFGGWILEQNRGYPRFGLAAIFAGTYTLFRSFKRVAQGTLFT